MPFPSVGAYTQFELVLRSAVGGGTLGTYQLLDYSGGEYRMNVSPLKPYGSNRQNFKGDETYIISNLIVTLRVTGTRATAMASLLTQLKATRALTLGSYSIEIAHAVGINSWSPLGENDSRVEVEFIPAETFWNDTAGIAVA